MRRILAITVPIAAVLLLCTGTGVMAQSPIRLDQNFSGFGPGSGAGPASPFDLAPPAPEPPREESQALGLRLALGGSLAPSTLDQLDAHDPHRLLERGLPGDGAATGLSPYLPERLGATLTFPF